MSGRVRTFVGIEQFANLDVTHMAAEKVVAGDAVEPFERFRTEVDLEGAKKGRRKSRGRVSVQGPACEANGEYVWPVQQSGDVLDQLGWKVRKPSHDRYLFEARSGEDDR
jgi:hypothetical protein